MLSKLRNSNPKRFYRKFKKRKQPVIHDISLEKFEEHFKNLTSKDNTGDINHDTTETVFDELDRPFDENELDLCNTKLKRDKAIGIDNSEHRELYSNMGMRIEYTIFLMMRLKSFRPEIDKNWQTRRECQKYKKSLQ